jgi:aspartate aminotransferase/aminotransferase
MIGSGQRKESVMRFSKSVTDIAEAMSITYNTKVYDLRRAGKSVTVLSLGEAFLDIPLYSMSELPFPEIYHYSHSRGLPQLREKLAKFLESEYHFSTDPATELLVTAGSKAAIHMTLMSILDPGDEVIVPEPAWVSYREQISLCYGVPVGVSYRHSVYELEQFITPKTKAIIVNTPHNPTGYVYTRKELRHLFELAEKHDLWILSDEAYSDFVTDGSFVSMGTIDPQKHRSVVFNSISKNYGISGWRLGYVIGNKELIYQVLKVNQHLITCPATILAHYVATYFDQIAAVAKPQILRIVEQRNAIGRFMQEIGLSFLPGTATFYFFVSIDPSRLGSQEFCMRLLEEFFVSAVPGIGYGESCDRFVRVSVGTGTAEESMHGLRSIKSLIDATT